MTYAEWEEGKNTNPPTLDMSTIPRIKNEQAVQRQSILAVNINKKKELGLNLIADGKAGGGSNAED